MTRSIAEDRPPCVMPLSAVAALSIAGLYLDYGFVIEVNLLMGWDLKCFALTCVGCYAAFDPDFLPCGALFQRARSVWMM
jgi:hypothetical protein